MTKDLGQIPDLAKAMDRLGAAWVYREISGDHYTADDFREFKESQEAIREIVVQTDGTAWNKGFSEGRKAQHESCIRLLEKRRDDYIREHCQTFNDGHWVGTEAQREYVSELDDIIELLKHSMAAPPKAEVHSSPECIFNYCPSPDACKASGCTAKTA